VPYTLLVKSLQEPDGNERNDHPRAATPIGNYDCGGARSFSPPKTTYLASRTDVDWYKLTAGKCAANIEVGAQWGGGAGQTLQPQVLLVYPDPAMGKCTEDKDCALLQTPGSCDNNDQCEHLGNQCDTLTHKCSGASLCLPEGFCGVLQYAKQQPAAGVVGPGISTAQPLLGQTYYIGVRDFSTKGFDLAPYNLSVRLDLENKDATLQEPDNLYTPYAPQNDPKHAGNGDRSHLINLETWYQGYIAYEGDKDFYKFNHPCPGKDCTLSVKYYADGLSPVYFTYQVQPADGGIIAGWPQEPAMRKAQNPDFGMAVFGDGVTTCFYAPHQYNGPFYLWVSDLLKQGGPKWDFGTKYHFLIHKEMDGCSDFCKKPQFKCGT
jgi:hypothetical protein